MKCTRMFCLMAMAILLMATGQVTATPVSESFDTFIKRSYLSPADTTWHGFHLTNGVCDPLKAYGGSGWSVRLQQGTVSPTPYMEYVGTDSLGKDGSVGTVSFLWRNWREFAVEYKVYAQINGGAYDSIGILNSTDTLSWHTFSYNLNTTSDNVRIKILKLSGERLMLDNFEISDYTPSDVTPPSISSITVADSTRLEVFFSESVSLTTAETEDNYIVTPGSTNPSLATRDSTNIALVHLTFASALPTGVGTLTANAVQDLSSNHNACTNATCAINDSIVSVASSFLVTAEGDSVLIYVSNGNGSFQPPRLAQIASGEIYGAAINDFNNDGYLDIVYQSLPGISRLLVNDGNEGFFQNAVVDNLDIEMSDSWMRKWCVSADFDRDGWADYMFPSRLNGQSAFIYVMWGVNGSVFVQDTIRTPWSAEGQVHNGLASADVGDTDEDGLADVVIVNYGFDTPTWIWTLRNLGGRSFLAQQTFSNDNPGGTTSIALGDFNLDYHLDAVVGQDDDGDAGQTWVHLGDGDGNFTLFGLGYDANPVNESGGDNPAGWIHSRAFRFDLADPSPSVIAPLWDGNTWQLARFPCNGGGTFDQPVVIANRHAFVRAVPSGPCSYPPSVTVTYPSDAGVSWILGEYRTIFWNSAIVTGNINIKLNRNYPNGTWEALTGLHNIPNTGSASWTVSGSTSTFCRIKVESVNMPGIYGIGDNDFSILSTPPLPEVGQISGIIRGEFAQPLDSVRVTVQGRVDTTGADGYYFIDNLIPGYPSLSATRPGYAPWESEEVAIAAGTTTTFNITLNREVLIVATVLDKDDNPLAGAEVTACATDYWEYTGITNTAGLCTLRVDVEHPMYSLRAIKTGYVPEYTLPFEVDSIYSRTIWLAVAQNIVPTYVFLIRGITASPPEDPNDDGWEVFEDSITARFPEGSHVIPWSVVINPMAAVCNNADTLRHQLMVAITTDQYDDQRIVLVGHSMGGIIARYYVAQYPDPPIDRVFTIGSPHHGSAWAEAHWVKDVFHCGMNMNWEGCNWWAFLDMSDDGMVCLNNRIRDEEMAVNVPYYFIGLSAGIGGDGAVNMHSQLGKDLFDSSSFRNSRIREKKIEGRPEGCPRFNLAFPYVSTSHACEMKDARVIGYVLDNLNLATEALASGGEKSATSELCQTIWQDVLEVHSNETRSDTFHIPSTMLLRITLVGLPVGAAWALESPQANLYDDSLSLAAIKGELLGDSTAQYMLIALPNPEAGDWVLHLGPTDVDSTLVAVLASAPVPLLCSPYFQEVVVEPGSQSLIAAKVTSVEGVAIDSVIALLQYDSSRFPLNDAGFGGDEAAGDEIWSAWTDTLWRPGGYEVMIVSFGHAGTEEYSTLENLRFAVESSVAQIGDSVAWLPVAADSNGLFVALEAAIGVILDTTARLRISASLTDSTGRFITATHTDDYFDAGEHTLHLSFDGKQIANHCVSGPYILRNVRLSRLGASGQATLNMRDSLSSSLAYDFVQFESRPKIVQDAGAIRNGESISVFWTPHVDPDIELFKVYYDTDGEEPYNGLGLNEGNSPITAGSSFGFQLTGADSAFSYTFSITAVDSSGSESNFSLPYTVFALAPPVDVNDLIIRTEDNLYILNWTAVSGSARYIIETAESVEGPWTQIAQTYSTTFSRSLEPDQSMRFFRVIATR